MWIPPKIEKGSAIVIMRQINLKTVSDVTATVITPCDSVCKCEALVNYKRATQKKHKLFALK